MRSGRTVTSAASLALAVLLVAGLTPRSAAAQGETAARIGQAPVKASCVFTHPAFSGKCTENVERGGELDCGRRLFGNPRLPQRRPLHEDVLQRDDPAGRMEARIRQRGSQTLELGTGAGADPLRFHAGHP